VRICLIEQGEDSSGYFLGQLPVNKGVEFIRVTGYRSGDNNSTGLCDYFFLNLNYLLTDPAEIISNIRVSEPHARIVALLGVKRNLTGFARAKKSGIESFLAYPWNLNSIQGLELVPELKIIPERKTETETVNFGIIGKSACVVSLLEFINKAGRSELPVLIEGESGTGKELVAKAIHSSGARAGKPLITINCGAMPRDLLENELFGHEAGAFTGATSLKRGLFEVSNGGTLFIDEIGEMDILSQVKLLRVLETGTFRRLGSTTEKSADVRIIAATNRVLENDIKEKKFRADLYYRLGVLKTYIPPLRERREDIPLLVEHILEKKINKGKLIRDRITLNSAAFDSIMAYSWPGNIRELMNVINRAAVMSDNAVIRGIDLPKSISIVADIPDPQPGADLPLHEFLDRAEKEYLTVLFRKHDGDKNLLAVILKISRAQLYRKLAKYNIR
jgi:transcriptional regulator with PAS, ATPase and Fis domain